MPDMVTRTVIAPYCGFAWFEPLPLWTDVHGGPTVEDTGTPLLDVVSGVQSVAMMLRQASRGDTVSLPLVEAERGEKLGALGPATPADESYPSTLTNVDDMTDDELIAWLDGASEADARDNAGGDPKRAERIADAEALRAKPRKRLIASLNKIQGA